MEEEKPYTSATKKDHGVYTPNIPHIQKDVEFVMKHLNDPNFDISRLPSTISATEKEITDNRYVGEDGGGTIDFDEWVALNLSLLSNLHF